MDDVHSSDGGNNAPDTWETWTQEFPTSRDRAKLGRETLGVVCSKNQLCIRGGDNLCQDFKSNVSWISCHVKRD